MLKLFLFYSFKFFLILYNFFGYNTLKFKHCHALKCIVKRVYKNIILMQQLKNYAFIN